MAIFLGIDPGASGGLAYVFDDSEDVYATAIGKLSEREIHLFVKEICDFGDETPCAVIELVHSSPQMGVKSAFTFGRSYGFLRGVLAANGIKYVEVRPQAWQKAMGCMTKGDKNVTKSLAQQLYPGEKVTHATADALLLATYARRHHKDLF